MTSAIVRLTLMAALAAAGCDKGATATPTETQATAAPPAQADQTVDVVRNVEAKPGDTTTCPYSGRTFVVKAEHPKVEYEGKSYWICSEDAAEKVRADPDAYLADFAG